MKQEDKERLSKHIGQEIESLEKDIVALKKGSKPVSPDNAIGRVTRMEAINSKSISEASLRNAKIKLAKLVRAFDMIDGPDFGLCAECGEPIPFKRLMIIPEAILCVGCAGRRQ
jgi:DnaK suppressor protein